MSATAPAPQASTHRVVALVLVVLGTLAAFLATAALWVNRQALNTDNWTKASSEMLADPAIRTATSDYLVDQLYANVDVAGEIRTALPPRVKPLAGPAAGAVRNLAEKAANELLKRPRVQTLWESANRVAHRVFLKIVDGGGPAVSTEGGVVKLDLGGVLQRIEERTGVGGKLVNKLPPGAAQLTIVKSDQLKTAQNVVKVLRPLPVVLLFLALAFWAGAIGLARGHRRETLRSVGFGLIVAGATALLARVLAGDAVVSALASTEAARPAAESVWRIGTSLLVQAAGAAIAYGVVIVLGAWLAGPTRAAVASRRTLAPYLREPRYAWGATLVIVLLVLLWGPTPALRKVVPALLLVLLFCIGVEALRRQTARDFPDARMPELGQAARAALERLRTASGRVRPPEAPAPGSPAPQAGNGGSPAPGPAAAPAPHAPPAPPEPAPDPLVRLERLADLHDRGALTDEEFATQKQQVLAGR